MPKTVRPTTLAAEAVHLDGDPSHHLADRAWMRTRRSWARSTCTICCARVWFEGAQGDAAGADPAADPGRRRRAHRRAAVFSARGAKRSRYFTCATATASSCLMAAGVAVAAFSGRRSRAVAARMRELRVPHLVQACSDKVAALHRLTQRLDIDPLNCACIVDDTPDLPLMSAVGMAGAVADAHPLVLSAAHWVAKAQGRPRGGARTVRCHAARPRRPTLMLFRVFTVLAVVALGISTWILSFARAPRRAAAQRQTDRTCRATI